MESRSRAEAFDYSVNLCVVGPVSVGKTSLIRRIGLLTRGRQDEVSPQPSLMAEFSSVQFVVDNKLLDAVITDTPGMKKLFHALPANILRNQAGYFVVFDLSDRATFTEIADWFGPVREYSPRHCEVFLVGNKADAASQRQVSPSEAIALAAQMNAQYFETSSKTGYNVGNAFQKMVESVCLRVDRGLLDKFDRGSGFKLLQPRFFPSDSLRRPALPREDTRNTHSSNCC